MYGVIVLVVLGVGVWLYLRSLGPKAPAGLNAVKKVEKVKQADVRVLYGTQTGTAQGFAKTLVREAHRLKVTAAASDLEDYHTHMLATEKVAVFVVATYGEGEPPDTMKSFHDWLMKEATSDDVGSLKYAVFGLGDRQYKHFCQMGVDIDEKLEELGAERIVGLGSGDAGQNLEEEFDQWRNDLWPCVGGALGLNLHADNEEPVEPELSLKGFDASMANAQPFIAAPPMMEPTPMQPVYATVIGNDDLLRGCADRCTRRIELSFKDSSISYQAGDHLGVLPCNADGVVDDYLAVLGAQDEADNVYALMEGQERPRNQWPCRQSVRVALKWYYDLAGPPKKSVLRAFAHYCTDPAQKAEFIDVLRTNDAAIAKYHKLQHQLRNTLGFLRHFSTCKVPLAHFLELMPRLIPRYFSISSDQLMKPTSIVITVALVQNGVCTTMLCGAKPGDQIPIFVRKSTFHLPLRDKKRPLVMIGPGTGVAPLVGFLERREAWKAKGQDLGPAMLFFGCRNAAQDFIHEDYLKQSEQSGTLSVLDVAFSRDGPQKVYVQHRIAQRAAEVWGLLSAGANLYICGDAKHMAKDVEATLIDKVFVGAGGMSKADATQKLADLVKQDRYHKDVWSA